MSNVYTVFNTTSEHEFSKFFDKLDLTPNELLNVTFIAENNSMSVDEKREKILEIMAGSNDGNYELCTEQFKKIHKQRVLKESSQLNLNQIMELNELVVNVAKKLKAPNCMQGIFNIIKSKAGAKIANTFLGMVQQSQVNNSNLKFNTDLQVNGKNLAEIIYALKNEIEMFINSVECEKEEPKEEIKENKQIVQETYAKYKQIVQEIDRVVDEVSNIDILKSISKRIDALLSRVKNMNEANEIAELKSSVETKISSLLDSKPQIEECLAQQVVADVCEEDTFDGLMKSLKPTVINITVNKEGGVEEAPCAEPQQCVEPISSPYPQPVEDMEISPNAIDLPILRKPNSAEATSAITALASHVNCVKSDSRENNIEELETINTLLAKLANYFNSVLNESEYKVGQKVIWKKNGMTYTISNVKNGFYDLKDGYSNKTYPVSKETLNSNFKILNESVNFDEMSEQEIKDYGMNILNKYNLNPNQEWKFKDMNRSFHPTSFYYNHKGMVVINIEYIGEDRHGINSGIITADGFEDNVKSGRLELLSIPEDYWDGEDEEDLMENKHYRVEVNDIEYDIPYSSEEEIELDDEDDTPDMLRTVIKDRIYDRADVYPYNFSYEITDSWSDDEENDEENEERSEYDNDYWDGEDEELTEDTVYDHSWYENESGKYPKRTKDGVIGLPIKETCSVGATCSANVSGFAKPLGSKPKKRKKSTIELDMFKESVQNDLNSALEINGQMVAYRIFEGKGYLYINEAILKETNKDAILEAIDDIYNECLETPVLEGFTPYQLEILMEEDLIQPENELEPQEQQELQDDLDNEINTNSNLKVGMLDNTGGISTEQEIVGVDDTDMNDKKYVLKDPQSGKVKIANASQIKVIGN